MGRGNPGIQGGVGKNAGQNADSAGNIRSGVRQGRKGGDGSGGVNYSIGVDSNDSLDYRIADGGSAITASQKIARDLGASSRAIQKAQPSAPSRDAELQAVRESASIPWYDIGALEAPATVASAQQPHPVEMLAMMGGPMAGEESDLASMELPVDPWEIAARSTLNRGLAKTIEEARQLVAEAI